MTPVQTAVAAAIRDNINSRTAEGDYQVADLLPPSLQLERFTRPDGNTYRAFPTDLLPFTNVCKFCAFRGTDCYSQHDFTCHDDARPDGQTVFFVKLP